MTLRVLPPGGGGGGGDGGGPDEPNDAAVNRNELAAASADAMLALAEKLTVRQRRFAEHLAVNGDTTEALFHAWPEAMQRARRTQLQYIGDFLTNPNVRAYIETMRGFGGLSIGVSFAAVMLVQWDIATDEKNSPTVRQLAASSLAQIMQSAGIAAAEGFGKPDKKALGKGADREPGALTEEDVDELEGILFGEEVG
jgi:hypothetical protein